VNYLDILAKFPSIRTAYYGHDLHYARLQNESELKQDERLAKEAEKYLSQEKAIWRAVDVVLYPSDEETTTIQELCTDVCAQTISPYTYPNAQKYINRKSVTNKKIIFVAGFGHPPNVDAAKWLVGSILPDIFLAHPDCKVYLIGSNPTDEVKALAANNIEITGYVTDEQLLEHYLTARVAVVPLRYGAGIKNKVVEAMAYGTPLVTTEIGAQGLLNLDEKISVSSDSSVFAKHVCDLLDDDLKWKTLSHNGIEFVQNRFSEKAMQDALIQSLKLKN
jgi:O-antigen biosynthesis protein